ncbi:MAG: methyltransferase domain-containing protein [Pseudomonadota bacterium]
MPETDDLYDSYQEWKSWDKLFSYTADHAGYFAGELADLKTIDADILEVGFGAGSCVAWLESHGARVSVTEINEPLCMAARDRGLAVLASDLPAIAEDYADSFDTILAFDVFEHLELKTVAGYLDACTVMLKPGGKMLLRFPNAQSPFGLKHQAGDPTHLSELSGAVIELILTKRPLEVTRYAGSYLYRGKFLTPIWIKRSIRRLLQKAINGFLRFVYASDIPYEPVVVIVIRKGP